MRERQLQLQLDLPLRAPVEVGAAAAAEAPRRAHALGLGAPQAFRPLPLGAAQGGRAAEQVGRRVVAAAGVDDDGGGAGALVGRPVLRRVEGRHREAAAALCSPPAVLPLESQVTSLNFESNVHVRLKSLNQIRVLQT